MNVLDKPASIREGEELDITKIEGLLKDSIPGLEGEITILQFPSGYSNLTYLLNIGGKELVLRRPPFGKKAKTAHDMSREFKILTALKPDFPYCPEPLLYVDDESIIGCPFYVMERIHGIILRKDPPEGLSFAPDEMRKLCENLVDVHVELHSIDYKKVGLENFGKPEGYVKRQVEGWCRRFKNARTEDVPDFEMIMAWLNKHMPPDTNRPTIIHNDYKFDNVVLDEKNPLKIIGILDWEMATIGDPLMDIGNSLGYWVDHTDPQEKHDKRMVPTTLEGAMTRNEVIDRYAEKSGIPMGNFDFYYCFGIFRLAAIAQQIYYRFYNKQTKDMRFETLSDAVRSLEEGARRVIEESDL